MEEWEAARIWKSKESSMSNKIDRHMVAGSITVLRRLEGLLIYYGAHKKSFPFDLNSISNNTAMLYLSTVHNMGKRNAKAIETILVDIQKLFKVVEKLLPVVEVIRARYNSYGTKKIRNLKEIFIRKLTLCSILENLINENSKCFFFVIESKIHSNEILLQHAEIPNKNSNEVAGTIKKISS